MVENGAQMYPKQHKEEGLNDGLPAASELHILTLHTATGQHVK